MRCVVTGGAGFIGSYVVDDLLAHGHKVVIIDDECGGYKTNVNPNAEWIKIDLQDLPRGFLKGVDVVFHLAAFAAEGLSIFTPTLNAQRNFVAFSRLIAECIEAGVRTFVFTSSMAVYGNNPLCPFDEEQPRSPVDPYGISKAACEQLLETYANNFRFDYVIIRPHNVYGIRQNISDPYRNVVGIFLRQILSGQPLTVFGDGLQKRSFSHINDIAPCIVRAAFTKKAYSRIINLGSAKPRTILDIVKALSETTKRKLDIEYLPSRISEVKNAYCTTDLSEKILGFQEKANFEEKIGQMYEWARGLTIGDYRWNPEWIEISNGLPEHWRTPGMRRKAR